MNLIVSSTKCFVCPKSLLFFSRSLASFFLHLSEFDPFFVGFYSFVFLNLICLISFIFFLFHKKNVFDVIITSFFSSQAKSVRKKKKKLKFQFEREKRRFFCFLLKNSLIQLNNTYYHQFIEFECNNDVSVCYRLNGVVCIL